MVISSNDPPKQAQLGWDTPRMANLLARPQNVEAGRVGLAPLAFLRATKARLSRSEIVARPQRDVPGGSRLVHSALLHANLPAALIY